MESKFFKEIFEWIKSIAIAGILALLIHTFLFAIVIVSGPSMKPTLQDGERLIMNKIIYNFSSPTQGDIIVFHASEKDDYIKRVIGVEGDKVEVSNNQLFINDQPIEEPYLRNIKTEDISPMIVPEGTVYVLGDNRNNSTDSRFIGPVLVDKVVGRVNILIWPLNKFSVIN